MGVFNKFTATFQESRQFLKRSIEEYIMFSSEAKQLTLTKKMVLLLCQQAESRVEQLRSLEPHSEEGLVATIEYNKIQVKLHFTPEKITLNKDCVEGELRLLNPPEFETESIVYRYLIAGWTRFLGGKFPNGALPKEVRIENNKVYYTLPRTQLQLLDSLFHSLENGSSLKINLQQGNLTVETSVALSWNNFKLQNLLQLLNLK
ncbi:hypothetical protein [Nostoc sp. UHCC 0251]|uniref:hypothetical protein n=1 Tax=Nostoc sp. UHCC 0251 TaxID=3110240 RepID=UPI002B20FD50|nr:hypothetical protein [Nostoc sp. UHCC 0251]MEA5627423.1 hypothetical protein [Nostoc sp. UHCC 0251]